MSATNLIKICVFALVLALVRSSAIPREATLTVLQELVRQDAEDKDNEDSKNSTSKLPTVTAPPKNETKDGDKDNMDKDKKEMDKDKKDEMDKDKKDEMDKDKKDEMDKDKGTGEKETTTTGNGTSNAANATKASNTTAPCFPATTLVTLEGGAQKQMSELSIGDRVAVGGGKYSEVFMFTHRLSDVHYEFVELHAGSNVLRATAGHYIYASGRYIAAGAVKVGDTLELADGTHTAVTGVKTVMDKGLYNPQTAHGDIIVNGVRASTFTTAIERNFAQAALSPLRAVFARLGLACTAFESGADLAANALPGGKIVA